MRKTEDAEGGATRIIESTSAPIPGYLPHSEAKRASGHGGGRGNRARGLLIVPLDAPRRRSRYLLLPPCPWLVIVSIDQ